MALAAASDYRIAPARLEDAGEILALQRCAFATEAELYGEDIPPMQQTLEEWRAEFLAHTILKATRDGAIVGSVRGAAQGPSCLITRLMVHPAHRRRGVASALLRTLEAAFPGCSRFELYTGSRSTGNLRLYAGLGYTPRGLRPHSARLTFVHLVREAAPGI